jgi:hypothetical protein
MIITLLLQFIMLAIALVLAFFVVWLPLVVLYTFISEVMKESSR